MTPSILVTGGTGTLGSHVVARLQDTGHAVRVLSRRPQDPAPGIEPVVGDLATGEGVAEAVAGIRTVVHLAGSAKGDGEKARRLVEAAQRAGVDHIAFISVVGADRVPQRSALDRAMFGYFGAKRAAEETIASSGIPWTTLRATQFHDLVHETGRMLARMPVVPVPSGFRMQPVDSRDVADRLVDLALGPPAGLVPELAGPRAYDMRDLVRDSLRQRGKHRFLLPVRFAGAAARAHRDGANLPDGGDRGTRTWEAFLDEQPARQRRQAPAPAPA